MYKCTELRSYNAIIIFVLRCWKPSSNHTRVCRITIPLNRISLLYTRYIYQYWVNLLVSDNISRWQFIVLSMRLGLFVLLVTLTVHNRHYLITNYQFRRNKNLTRTLWRIFFCLKYKLLMHCAVEKMNFNIISLLNFIVQDFSVSWIEENLHFDVL